ncbi:MAG: polysaccharide biosynthesis/export family protein [Sphingorhabdus sp.]
MSLLRFIVSLLCLTAASLSLAGCTSGTEGLSAFPYANQTEYRLDSGDKIRIVVQDLDTLSKDYVIDDSGAISLPLVEVVQARGKTFRQLEQDIEAILTQRQILTKAVVNVQQVDLRPFYILGEVRTPGEYTYRPGTTVLSAVSLAGGYTYRADTSTVVITRTVDGKQATGKAAENTAVFPGDRIRVLEKWF